jgi:biotin operon repressor
MSLNVLKWARAQNVPTAICRAVLNDLAWYANDSGICWPSQETIANGTGYKRRAVNSAINSLREIGLVIYNRRQYRLNIKSEHQRHLDEHEMHSYESAPDAHQSAPDAHHCAPRAHPSEQVKEQVNKPVRKKSSEMYNDDFTKFWGAFPPQRKGSKEKAFRNWLRVTKEDTPENILAGVRRYCKSEEVSRGFAKMASGWLNDERWKDNYVSANKSKDERFVLEDWSNV